MSPRPLVVAAVYLRSARDLHAATVRSMLRAGVERVVVGAREPADHAELLFDDRVEIVAATHVASFVNAVSERFRCLVVACDEPVLVPENAFGPTVRIIDDDSRVPTVSYWCNFAGYLSFPHQNAPASHQQGDLDERSGTERLRRRSPAGRTVSIPLARGPLVAISRMAITACGPLIEAPFDDLSVVVAEFGLRASARGFTPVLDPTTYVVRPFDLADPGEPTVDLAPAREWLHERHAVFPVLYDSLLTDRESPVSQAHGLARAAAVGLRILVDGSVMGALETGTQVQLMHVVAALARRDDVREIVVSMPGPVPEYARAAFGSPKIQPVVAPAGAFPPELRFDVVHRPYQPDRPLPLAHWRTVARRIVITVQDLIAYRNGAYHSSSEQWIEYRRGFHESIANADAIAVISNDVRRAMELDRLPVEPSRIGLMLCGTDHLSGDEATSTPAAFLDPLYVGRRFLLVLGTTYLHKNRDLAIRAWQELRRRGHDHLLVVVGAEVPFGSSRHLEALALGVDDDGVINLLDVSSAERNWLFRHADAVLYPTSAEGFGFVPFEAAAFGTPTVAVSFGPLAEVQPDSDAASTSWQPFDLADAVERLLDDPDAVRASVAATRRSGNELTWDRSAEMLVELYRRALACPASPDQTAVHGG
jgi:glycosyltransferase involved in cell wall biosynthesis